MFQVAVDDPFLVRVLDSAADRQHQLQSLSDRQLVSDFNPNDNLDFDLQPNFCNDIDSELDPVFDPNLDRGLEPDVDHYLDPTP